MLIHLAITDGYLRTVVCYHGLSISTVITDAHLTTQIFLQVRVLQFLHLTIHGKEEAKHARPRGSLWKIVSLFHKNRECNLVSV